MSLVCLLAAPLPNAGVVAGEEHVGDAHAAVLGGPGVLRPAGWLGGKAVLRQRLGITHHAGYESRDGVDQDHGGGLTAAQHIVADRDLARTPRGDAALHHSVLRRGDEVLHHSVAADTHVVGRTLQNLGDLAQGLAGARQDGQTDDLVMVVTALGQRAHRSFGDLEVAPAKQLRDGAIVDAAEFHDQARIPSAAPLDFSLGAFEHEARADGESILKVCQGNHLDSSVHAIRPRHLPDPDHARGLPPERLGRSSCPETDGFARSTKTRLRSRRDATLTNVRIASMLRPALPMKRPTSSSASFTLIATVPAPRSKDSTRTSSGFSASDFATYSTSAL